MKRPYIGITTSLNSDGAQSLHSSYIHAVETAGGIPVIVPMVQQESSITSFAALLDGLIITGGPGILHGLIGPLPDELPPVKPERDRNDRWIFEAVNQRQRPILGICYGMQFLNAWHQGTIYGDVQTQRPNTLAHSSDRNAQPHSVSFEKESLLAKLLDTHLTQVNTFHFQAVAQLGEGLCASIISEDGVIEGIESADGRMIGVQFHPERMPQYQTGTLFAYLVEQARK